MKKHVHRVAGRVPLGVFLFILAATGCRDERRHSGTTGIPYAATSLPAAEAAPAEVVRTFLVALSEAQTVRARGMGSEENRAAYKRAMGTITGLAARREILEGMRKSDSRSLPHDLTEETAVTITAESWVSIAAYYADGFLFESLDVTPLVGAQGPGLKAVVEAVRPEDAERLARIEKSLTTTAPSSQGSMSEHWRAIREKTIESTPAFNVPIRARFALILRKTDNGWRIAGMAFDQGRTSVLVPPDTIRSGRPTGSAPAGTAAPPVDSPPPFLAAPKPEQSPALPTSQPGS